MPRVSDSVAFRYGSQITPSWMWPSPSQYRVGTPGEVIALRGPFGVAARWLACVCPCQRFAYAVARVGAGLGVKMVCYSFLVRLLHPLLSAGFDRRFHDVPGIKNACGQYA